MARRLADQARAMAMNSYSAAATADAFSRLFAEVSANVIGR
jgi:hypothetical protein